MLDDAPPAGGAVRARADEIGPIPPEPAWDASDWDGLIRVLPFATGNSQPVREMLAAGLSAQIDLGGHPAVACRLPTTVPTGPKAARPVQRVHIKPALAFHGAPRYAARSKAAHGGGFFRGPPRTHAREETERRLP
jgi:hypothetical protein